MSINIPVIIIGGVFVLFIVLISYLWVIDWKNKNEKSINKLNNQDINSQNNTPP